MLAAGASLLLVAAAEQAGQTADRAPNRVAVRPTVQGDSVIAARRCWLPLRAAARLRLPADSGGCCSL
jgi:hypothetical protein